MEIRLLDFVEILAEATTPEEKTEVLLKAIDDSCDVTGRALRRRRSAKAEQREERRGGLPEAAVRWRRRHSGGGQAAS